jgi:hypothetical protein
MVGSFKKEMSMKRDSFSAEAVVALIGLLCLVGGRGLASGGPQEVRWNTNARSAILNKDALTSQAVLLPWKIAQMTWPPESEITACSVRAPAEAQAAGMGWIRRFVRQEFLPADLESHLVAMKDWGLIRERTQQKRCCDVFIARFNKGPLVAHIQESPYNVVICVADERLSNAAAANQKGFVLEMAKQLLSEGLQPASQSDVSAYGDPSVGEKTAKFSWPTTSVRTTDSNGKRCISYVQAQKNGAIHARAETDGRFIRFEIIKYAGGPAIFSDPYVKRFQAPEDTGGSH